MIEAWLLLHSACHATPALAVENLLGVLAVLAVRTSTVCPGAPNWSELAKTSADVGRWAVSVGNLLAFWLYPSGLGMLIVLTRPLVLN